MLTYLSAMKTALLTECLGCGSQKARIILEIKYSGLRGRCTICGGDWAES